jgi:acetyltransferase
MDKHYLNPLFSPESIAVFAGQWDDPTTQTPQAQTLLTFLRAQRFSGTLTFLDIHTTGTLADLAQTRADLAIIALPHEDVAAALDIAGRPAGPQLPGLPAPACCKLNASVAGPWPRPGRWRWCRSRGRSPRPSWTGPARTPWASRPWSRSGPTPMVDIAQVLGLPGQRPQTHSIVVYMEGISNARRFMSALRSAANAKPVVVLKAGRKPAGNEAAQTHSGAIVGSDDVFDAACAARARCACARSSSCSRPPSAWRRATARWARLAIVTNGGGPGVLAADWVSEINLQLGSCRPIAVRALQPQLPPLASL